jgi:hypothetical protein
MAVVVEVPEPASLGLSMDYGLFLAGEAWPIHPYVAFRSGKATPTWFPLATASKCVRPAASPTGERWRRGQVRGG